MDLLTVGCMLVFVLLTLAGVAALEKLGGDS
jgi:hypothetical protein